MPCSFPPLLSSIPIPVPASISIRKSWARTWMCTRSAVVVLFVTKNKLRQTNVCRLLCLINIPHRPPPPRTRAANPTSYTEPPAKKKVTHDRQRGLLSFFRVYSGTLEAKQPLYNSTRGEEERPLQVLCSFTFTSAPVGGRICANIAKIQPN